MHRLVSLPGLGCTGANVASGSNPDLRGFPLHVRSGAESGIAGDTVTFWRDRVHGDDLARVEEAIAKFFQNGVHAVEYRFRRKDGSFCWVNDEQRLIRDKDGKPLEIVSSWSDITARKAAEEAKAAAHARLSQLLTSSPAIIYSYRATETGILYFTISEDAKWCHT
jgi:PAS domain-containing protein